MQFDGLDIVTISENAFYDILRESLIRDEGEKCEND